MCSSRKSGRAITPVIAIVVLLVMTISAGGLAYLTITGYQNEAARSGMSGMEQTFESLSEQVKVESISNGQMIVRNTGSRSIEDFSPLVLVNGIPVQSISSKGTLAPGETAIIDLRIDMPTQGTVVNITTPSGNTVEVTHTGKCTTVGISTPGQSAVHQSGQCYDLPDLVTCVVDGVCDIEGTENAFNCPADCGLLMMAGSVELEGVGNKEVYIFTFNQTLDASLNLTETADNDEEAAKGVYDSEGNYMATWLYDGLGADDLIYRFWNKSEWSPKANITQSGESTGNTDVMADGDGNVVIVFQDASNDISASVWNGAVWSPVGKVSVHPDDAGRLHKQPDGGMYGGRPLVLWLSYLVGPDYDWVRSAVWNGTDMVDHANITILGAGRPSVVTSRSGPATAVFGEYVTPYYQIRSAQWNGYEWSNYLNVSGFSDDLPGGINVGRDAAGRDVAIYLERVEGEYVTHWSVLDGGQWSAPQAIGGPVLSGMTLLLDNLPGGVVIGWFEDFDTHFELRIAEWDPFAKTFPAPRPLLNCTLAVVCTLV